MINKYEEQIVMDYACKKISREHFFEALPLYADDSFLIDKFKSAISSKDSREITFLRMIPIENLQILLPIYRELIIENWHIENEDIASFFQNLFNNDRENIPVLLKSVNIVPLYLQFDEMKYPYIRKIIYAIGAQPAPENIEALEKLANETTDQQIKDLALHQIKKRKELGRWEAAKNAQ